MLFFFVQLHLTRLALALDDTMVEPQWVRRGRNSSDGSLGSAHRLDRTGKSAVACNMAHSLVASYAAIPS